jgi:hypothetical protein
MSIVDEVAHGQKVMMDGLGEELQTTENGGTL